MFVYFLKKKSDTVPATEKYLADISPYGRVKYIRSDNGTEFMRKEFQTLMRKYSIRHERSAPSSPHQNGTAERGGCTLFEMGRCMLTESKRPKHLWHDAIQTAAMVRNRCYNRRTGQTPYQLLTGKKANLSKMQKFRSTCYVYKHDKGKLDSKCDQGTKQSSVSGTEPRHKQGAKTQTCEICEKRQLLKNRHRRVRPTKVTTVTIWNNLKLLRPTETQKTSKTQT